ncbi:MULTISPECIES: hypothetical protein [Asaia]|uniref:hypothetical protein n=1 Tax=Asaia TaxID=91914 RepID=UPI002FC38B58
MPRFLLSWHGTILCHEEARLFCAPLADVASGRARPVLVSQCNEMVEGPCSLTVVTDVVSDPEGVIALRAGQTYLTANPDNTMRLSDACDDWEHYLPVSLETLDPLDALTSRRWLDDQTRIIRPRLDSFRISIGDVPCDPRGFAMEPDGAIRHPAIPRPLRPWPNAMAGRALSAVLLALAQGDTGRKTIWAQWPDLARQVTLTLAEPDHPAHLYYLARLCTLLGLLDEADLCLQALSGAMNEADRLWASSIVAAAADDDEKAAQLLGEAFTKAAGTRHDTAAIAHHTARILAGSLTHRSILRGSATLLQVRFDGAFDLALMPGKLPPDADYHLRADYYHALEEAWSACPQAGRDGFLAQEERLNGVSHALLVIQGHNHWLKGAWEAADACYDQARLRAIEDGFRFIHFNCGAYSWLTDTERPPEPDPLSVENWQWHHAANAAVEPQLCLVAGCDASYFRFVPKFLASLVNALEKAPTPPRIHLVLGLSSPTGKQLDFLTQCSASLAASGSSLALSFAHGRLTHPDGASYASLRYLLMPEIVKRQSCPVLTLDIDAMIPSDFPDLIATLQADFDYGFRLYAFDGAGHQYFGEPWGFGAGVSYFGETDHLPVIAQALHDYLVTAYRSANPTNWCVDQCALSAVYHRHIAPRWDSLRIRFMDDDPAIVIMPHHVGMDKRSFGAWEDIVDMDPVFTRLGINPDHARLLGRPA